MEDRMKEEAIRAMIEKAIATERERCAAVVQEAREGERDSDLRSIIYGIKNP